MNSLRNIALLLIFGKPLIVYLGIVTFLSFASTAIIGRLIIKGKRIPLKNHLWLARISIILAVIHGLFAISIYL